MSSTTRPAARAALARSSARPEVDSSRKPSLAGFDRTVAAEHVDALQGVFQLADVARPGMGLQALERAGRELPPRRAEALGHPPGEMLGQLAQVAVARPQGRHRERDHGQPVVEILAEAPRLDLGAQVAVGGGDHPHVDRHRILGAEGLDHPLLEHPQQLDLGLAGQEIDVVEHHRAPFRLPEEPPTGLIRPREGPLFVPEERGFDQRGRQSGEADHTEGLGGSPAGRVERPGRSPLADAGLALEEHRRIARRHGPELVGKRPEGLTRADEISA